MMSSAVAPRKSETIRFAPRGAARAAFTRRDPELLLSGPAGTGKSRACLEKLHLCLNKYPGARALMLRKTLTSLTSSTIVTYNKRVLHPLDGVTFFGGSSMEPPHFRYPNGSTLTVGGMDKPSKIMSTDYDMAYVPEATELNQDEWESITTRLRYGCMPFQQLLADCNPDRPQHWLKLRSDAGVTAMLESRHIDNPLLHDGKTWTPEGVRYVLGVLGSLTGVRRLRLRDGIWAAAEGMIYEDAWDRAVNLIDPFPIPADWPRFWVIDFGYTNPFVWQAWAIDPDGRMVRYREIYMTRRLVEDHAKDILQVTGWARTERGQLPIRDDHDPLPFAIICDHDAEDRATFEKATGLLTQPAYKAVSPGIQATASRMRVEGDAKPRLMLMRDVLVERDEELAQRSKPTCTEEEIEGYVWDITAGRRKGEQPVKEDDHGMDTTRYAVAFVDDLAIDPHAVDDLYLYDEPVSIGPRY